MFRICLACIFMLAVAVSAKPCNFTGVNLSGAEYASGTIPGILNSNYIYPPNSNVDYFVGKGMNVFRIPFVLERIQKYPGGPLSDSELSKMDSLINYITETKQKFVLLDPHNYGSAFNGKVGESASPISVFADFWFKLASHYASNPKIIFGLMNEPNKQSAEVWSQASQAAIFAIRRAKANQLILVPGVQYTGAHSWISSKSGFYMQNITDPYDNYAFEVHQYLDSDNSGTHDECVSEVVGANRLRVFTNWARSFGKRGFLGEFGGSKDTTCMNAINNTISHMEENLDVWLGWTYWAGGPWWNDAYFSNLQPNKTGIDRPQMAVIQPHINVAGTPVPMPRVLPKNTPDFPSIYTKNTFIYEDSLLSPFGDYSWAKRQRGNSTYKYKGETSFEFTMNSAFAALRFTCPGGCFDNSDDKYLTLDFWFMSPTGSTGINAIQINLLDENTTKLEGSRTLQVALEKTPTAYEWVHGVIPVTAFKPRQMIHSIQIASTSANPLPVMFLDEISLVQHLDNDDNNNPTNKPTNRPTIEPNKPTDVPNVPTSAPAPNESSSSVVVPSLVFILFLFLWN